MAPPQTVHHQPQDPSVCAVGLGGGCIGRPFQHESRASLDHPRHPLLGELVDSAEIRPATLLYLIVDFGLVGACSLRRGAKTPVALSAWIGR